MFSSSNRQRSPRDYNRGSRHENSDSYNKPNILHASNLSERYDTEVKDELRDMNRDKYNSYPTPSDIYYRNSGD